ncbi:hypothetical protein FMM74_016840 [Lachnospiraceae bacterium MD308]|nr:hypothetical protein [Lachnospiraceae bacterium MD308]
MYRSPNEDYKWMTSKEKNKKNQIGRKFSNIFKILLDPNYYEGTPYGKYFNEINREGHSSIYINDDLEVELKQIKECKNNEMKYLVGFTAIGKTTLLKNFFKVHNRDVLVDDENLIIYISFYSADLLADNPQQSVENEIVSYISRAINILLERKPEIIEDESLFWNDFYDYINKIKPTLLQSEDLIPDSSFFSSIMKKTNEQKKQQLINTCKRKRTEYHSSMLKFVLKHFPRIKNVIFIYDDIETKEAIFHRPLVEVAQHIHSCFSLLDNKESHVKTIVSLRAYTFRSNIDRQLEARRQCIEESTILKKKSVDIHDIFSVRFREIEKIEKQRENVKNLNSYIEAKKQLSLVEDKMAKSFGNIIYKLANCNLCNAMVMYSSVLVNVEWISKNEYEKDGRFRVSAENYRLTADNVFSALACGNESAYSDKNNKFFPNLLRNYKEEGTELFNLYIIRYLIRKEATDLYGEKYVEGQEILKDIVGLFVNSGDSTAKMEIWQSKVWASLTYLHNTGVLLRSIYDIEDINEEQIERKYNGFYKLYLSPRGLLLYELFSKNALLLQLYRDDICTDIENNDKITNDLKTDEILKYLLEYISKLFACEKKYISNASFSLKKYCDLFGQELITALLLEGVVINIKTCYPENTQEYKMLMHSAKNLIREMKHYISIIKKEYNIIFKTTDYLEHVILEEGKVV